MPRHWWLLTQTVQGEINGLPHMRGQAVATNGILVALEPCGHDTPSIFIGHREWFMPDKDEPSLDAVDRKPKAVKEQIKLAESIFV